MCDDVEAALRALKAKDVACEPVSDERWGRVTRGGTLGLYEPRHARP